MPEENTLTRKVGWAYNVQDVWPSEIKSISRCQMLEDEGFGILADEFNSKIVHDSGSIVCPDGSVFTPEQIKEYWIKERIGYNAKNPEHVKMHKAYLYHLGYISL